MLSLCSLRNLLLTFFMLMILVACTISGDLEDGRDLVVISQHEVNEFEDAERHGMKIYIEQGSPDNSFVAVTLCVNRKGLPDDISSFFSIMLNSFLRSQSNERVFSVSQNMFSDKNPSGYDLGRFRIRLDFLQNAFVSIGYSNWRTGSVVEDEWANIAINFEDIAEQMMLEERTFRTNLDGHFCEYPSGRYVGR